MAEDILPPVGALGAVVFECVRCGLVSCELLWRDLVLPAAEAFLFLGGADRMGGRPGEFSREASGEDLEVDACVAA